MKYSDCIKDTLLREEPKKVCCSRALCCGLFVGAEPTVGKEEQPIRFRTEQESVAALGVRLVKSRFGKEAELTVGSRPGHKVYILEFSSKPLRKFLTGLTMPLPTDPTARRALFSLKCPDCRAAFLRGLFLGCGSVSDPESAFHLEFRLPPERANAVAEMLEEIQFEEGSVPPHRALRREKIGLYYKRSTVIGEFFSLIGENGIYFAIADKQIERQIRAAENRLTNCETKNIEKTVTASLAQIAAVKELFLSGEIERLPQELRETAVLRLEYDDDSLSALAQRHVPPITKSGLNNRLRRIMTAARESRQEREATETKRAEHEG